MQPWGKPWQTCRCRCCSNCSMLPKNETGFSIRGHPFGRLLDVSVDRFLTSRSGRVELMVQLLRQPCSHCRAHLMKKVLIAACGSKRGPIVFQGGTKRPNAPQCSKRQSTHHWVGSGAAVSIAACQGQDIIHHCVAALAVAVAVHFTEASGHCSIVGVCLLVFKQHC